MSEVEPDNKDTFSSGEEVWIISTTGPNLTKRITKAKIIDIEEIGNGWKVANIESDDEECHDRFVPLNWVFRNWVPAVETLISQLMAEISEYEEAIARNNKLIEELETFDEEEESSTY